MAYSFGRTLPTYGEAYEGGNFYQNDFTSPQPAPTYSQPPTSLTARNASLDTLYQGAPQVSYGGSQPSGPIQFGQNIDQSRFTSGGRTYVERGDGGFGEWMDNPGTWNLEGLDFGAPPVAGAKPVVGSQYGSEGRFEGWAGPGGESYTPYSPEMYNQMVRVYQENGIDPSNIGRFGNFIVTRPQEGINHLSKKGLISKYAAMAAGATILGGAAAYGGLLGTGAQSAVGGGALAGGEGAAAGAGALGGEAALGGLGGIEPISYSGFTAGQGGIGSLGSGWGTAGVVAGEGGAATLGSGIAGSAGTASTISQVADYVKKGMSVQEALKLVAGSSGGTGGTAGTGGGGGSSILDLLGAYYSAQQMKDYSGNLKEMYSTQRGIQQPYLEQLLASYKDPNTFYNSNQWKGLESVYQNSIDRKAAQTGRMANPTDREVLLQQHAMKGLEDYRRNLLGAVTGTDPANYAKAYAEGLKAEAYANTAPFAAATRGGTGTNVLQTVNDTWKTIQDVGSTAEDVWKFIEGWFS